MNNYEDWAQLVAKKLEHESNLLAAIDKDEFDDAGASEAFVRAVLEPFMPENYGIGSGRIVDAFGNHSDYLEIIVYNRDFPRIGMRGTHSAYLYESVLAAFAIRAKFVRKTFFDALDASASIAALETNTDKASLVKLAAKNGLKAGPNKTFVHQDPLRTARFQLIGRPPAFVFGFSGFKYSYRQLQENLELWLQNRVAAGIATPMQALPAVIATQGCFAWRNAAPLALSNREMMGIGNDDSPIRLIVLQLLYMLNRRLQVSADGYGLRPTLSAYLGHFAAPKFEVGVGNVAEVFDLKPVAAVAGQPKAAAEQPAPAEQPTAARPAAARPAAAQPAAAKPAPAKPTAKPAAPKPAAKPATPPAADVSAGSGVFDKPSPFASKPKPPAQAEAQPAPAQRSPAPAPPLGSAPIPGLQRSAPAAPAQSSPAPAVDRTPARAPLGSAPIPPSQPAKPPQAPLGSAPIPPSVEAKPAASAAPPKPPVDFDLGTPDTDEAPKPAASTDDEFASTVVIPPDASAAMKSESEAAAKGNSGQAAQAAADDDDFSSTLVIPPDASASIRKQTLNPAAGSGAGQAEEEGFVKTEVIPPGEAEANRNKSQKSSDEFIARVKQQLSSSEPIADDEKDFTSTIPQ